MKSSWLRAEVGGNRLNVKGDMVNRGRKRKDVTTFVWWERKEEERGRSLMVA